MTKIRSGARAKDRPSAKRGAIKAQDSIVARKLSGAPAGAVARAGKKGVVLKRVHVANEPSKTLLTVDAGSSSFGADLQYAFERNVARARRENKKQFGAADPNVGEN